MTEGLPPLPPGFVLDTPPAYPPPPPARPADPYKLLKDEGFTFTNGYRTDADTARIRTQGYKPATNSLHKAGDGVDVNHPNLTPAQQTRRLRQLLGGWKGAFIDDEGHHRHVQLPGWGEAPGTPGTKNSGLPPLPPGFELQQRGALTGGNFVDAPIADERTARIATIKQNGFAPQEEARLIGNVEREYSASNPAPVVASPTRLVRGDQVPEGAMRAFTDEQKTKIVQFSRSAKSGTELDAFARSLSGGKLGIGNADEVIKARNRGSGVNSSVADPVLPVVVNTDGAVGSFSRGLADPFMVLDEVGAVVDTLGLTGSRENVWNSDRSAKDILFDNIDLNRGVLKADERDHPYARIVGQLTSGVALPYGAGFRTPMQLAKLGAAEGALAGFGGAEGNPLQRLPGAVQGAAMGAAGGAVLGKTIEVGAPLARKVVDGFKSKPRGSGRSLPNLPDGFELADGPHGAIHRELAADYPAALERLRTDRSGAVPGAIRHPDIGDIDLVWGNGNYGLSKIVAKHPEVVDDLPAIVERLPVKQLPSETGNQQFVLEDDVHRAVVAPDFNGVEQRWLVTAFERKGAPGGLTNHRSPLPPDGMVYGRGATDDVASSGLTGNAAPGRAMAAEFDDGSATVSARMVDAEGLPPIPEGFVLDTPLGRARPMGERLSADDIAAAARGVNPEDVTPIPANSVESPDEVPGSLVPIEGPGSLGRAPKRPVGFSDYLRRELAGESRDKGLPVRIDAEDAIDKGVPAELIYRDPGVADKSKLQLRNPGLFGTRYGRMSAAQQDLRSLDMDSIDPAQWGFDSRVGQRLDPEDVADLLRRDLEGDASALERGSGYDDWSAYQDRAAEKAEFEGRYGDDPPVEQRGEPATFDDLNSINLPASAYEDGPRVTGTIGNINLNRLENPGDVSRLIGQVRAQVGGFDEASRGVVTNAETRALADELGLTPEQLLKRRRGQALNAEELYATRVLVQKSREVVARLAKASQGGTDEQLAQFRNAWMRHVALEEHATAATAEVGRAMQSFKMLARSGDARGEAVKAYLRGGGGRETVEEAAAKLVDMMDNPGAASRFMRDGAKARTRDMLNEFWINSLLSGPKTHIVNAASNTLTALYTLPEHALTAAIGKVLGTPDRALLVEVSQRAVGMIEGAREGLKLAKHAFLTGEPSDAITKVETANYHAIPGRAGEIIRLPTRALTSADEFFKAVNRRGALNAMAYRRAQAGGGTAAERMQRFQDLVAEPDKMLRDYADNQARYLTFQSPLGEAGRGLTQFINRVPGLKLIVPFIRTPINLLKFAGERSVFAPGLKEFRDAWKAGGNERNQAVARMTMGTGLSALAVSYALDGKLSGGGPTDPRERAALVNSGWQPYSMKLGDRWVSYQRFDPVSMLIGAAADFAEVGTNATAKEGEDIALGLGIAVAKNVTSKTWLSGLSDFFEVLTDPERYGESWAKRMGGSLAVPALGAHMASATDPNMREVNSVLDAIKNRVPGLSHDLLARRNVWGDEIARGNGAGGSALSSAYSFVSPVSSSLVKASPLLREVARLRAPLSMPQRRVRVGGVDRPLTPEQYAMYVQLAGKPAKAHLEEYVGTPEWKALSDDERRDYLADTLKETRADAREQLIGMFPELSAAADLPPMPPGYQLPPLPSGFQLAR